MTSKPTDDGMDDQQDQVFQIDDPDAPETAGLDLQQLKDERDQLYQRLARAQADYQNSRRRLEADMETRIQYANSALIKSLLPVIDNFERALAVDPAKTESAAILKGLQLVHDQWLQVLKSQLVGEIAPEPGTPFDPNLHSAVMQQPDDQYSEPTVTQLLQKGYTLGDRVLRPAQVAVSKTG